METRGRAGKCLKGVVRASHESFHKVDHDHHDVIWEGAGMKREQEIQVEEESRQETMNDDGIFLFDSKGNEI